eukprot:6521365-Heterocapsa_arctica.AAC.1
MQGTAELGVRAAAPGARAVAPDGDAPGELAAPSIGASAPSTARLSPPVIVTPILCTMSSV